MSSPGSSWRARRRPTMADIYDQHKAAFANVSAFVVLKDGERVATVAIKFPRDGAGRLYAYVHWIGLEMVRGSATGYGYDKRSAAVSSAAGKLAADWRPKHASGTIQAVVDQYTAFREAALKD